MVACVFPAHVCLCRLPGSVQRGSIRTAENNHCVVETSQHLLVHSRPHRLARKIRWHSHCNRAATHPNPAAAAWNSDDTQDLSDTENSADFSGFVDGTWDSGNDDEMLALITGLGDYLPIVRTYRNDLCTLEICGCAARARVLAAMASDRSFTAARDLFVGRRLTVLQTVLPGTSGDHSTVSTKLFAPSLSIVEKAKNFSLPNGVDAGEFVHKFFEAVQMVELSKFYIEFHSPGTRRDMSALKQEEMVQTMCSFEASSNSALDAFGKAIATYAIFCKKKNACGQALPGIFRKLWRKPEWVPSSKAPVKLSMLSAEEVQSQVKYMLERVTGKDGGRYTKPNHSWWPAPALALSSSKGLLDGVTENWIIENVPMHKLHIDLGLLDGKLTRDSQSTEPVNEILLTHAQLVDLVGVFDLYYEDRFTLSEKDLVTDTLLDFHCVPRSKAAVILQAATIISIFLGLGIFGWLTAMRIRKPAEMFHENHFSNSTMVTTATNLETKTESLVPINEQLRAEEMEALCKSVIADLVEAFAWPVEVHSSKKGAWTQKHGNEVHNSQVPDASELLSETPHNGNERTDPVNKAHVKMEKLSGLNVEMIHQALDEQKRDVNGKKEALLYQVVLSRKGKLLGFQPLNQEAASMWSQMPYAHRLHRQMRLASGFWERPLKYEEPPVDPVVIELRVLMDQDPPVASARPYQL